jgi:hypothetical protein
VTRYLIAGMRFSIAVAMPLYRRFRASYPLVSQ